MHAIDELLGYRNVNGRASSNLPCDLKCALVQIVIGNDENAPESEESAAMEKAMDELYASRELPVD